MGGLTEYQIPPPATVQELAKLARCAFSLETRDNGSEYWNRNQCAPEWIMELCHTAHGDMLPDDYRYRFIVQALDALEEAEDPDEARDGYEVEYRYYRVVEWLSSHPARRLEYCDDAVREFGLSSDATTATQLQIGHLSERLEVLELVRGSLEQQLQAMAADIDDPNGLRAGMFDHWKK